MNDTVSTTKARRVEDIVIDLLNEHARSPDGLPTTARFLFYELEQRGLAQKPQPDDNRRNRRRSIGWPPGQQDVTDAITRLRNEGILPWEWIADTERNLNAWRHAPTVLQYVQECVPKARINPWHPDPPPLILTESRAVALALDPVAAEYVCPIAGVKGQSAGFLRTRVAPILKDNRRHVLYLGDLDRSGVDIERNTWTVLEAAADRLVNWTRIGLTREQAEGIAPIWKIDGRDGKGHEAWEVESLGQAPVVALVRDALDARLPEPLTTVHEREQEQRQAVLHLLGGAE